MFDFCVKSILNVAFYFNKGKKKKCFRHVIRIRHLSDCNLRDFVLFLRKINFSTPTGRTQVELDNTGKGIYDRYILGICIRW